MHKNSNYRCTDVFAVIVTYNPDLDILDELLDSLLPQISQAIIVDNCSSADISDWFNSINHKNVTLHKLNENYGIAYAQNIGIKKAVSENIKFVLLSDQDSKPAENMVFELKSAVNKLLDSGKKVAAAGPCYVDARQDNPPPFLKIEGLLVKRQVSEHMNSVVEVDYVIASGCLIPIAAFNHIGLMNNDLFIDYVDIEWGIRAKTFGFQSYGIFAAKMSHSLGDEHVSFLGRKVTLHSPLRHYYLIRNGFWLYKQKHMPTNWKIVDGYRMLLRMCFYTIFAKPRRKHFSMMMTGLVHGLRSRMGRY